MKTARLIMEFVLAKELHISPVDLDQMPAHKVHAFMELLGETSKIMKQMVDNVRNST